MRKNKQTWSVKTLVFLALLVAIQLVLSRVLVIDLGVYRITLGTVATVLALSLIHISEPTRPY